MTPPATYALELLVPPLAIGRTPVTSEEARFTAEELKSPAALLLTIPVPRDERIVVPVAVNAPTRLVLPITSNLFAGEVVPIPRLPEELITTALVPLTLTWNFEDGAEVPIPTLPKRLS